MKDKRYTRDGFSIVLKFLRDKGNVYDNSALFCLTCKHSLYDHNWYSNGPEGTCNQWHFDSDVRIGCPCVYYEYETFADIGEKIREENK